MMTEKQKLFVMLLMILVAIAGCSVQVYNHRQRQKVDEWIKEYMEKNNITPNIYGIYESLPTSYR